MIDDLAAFGCPVLLFSGGEPLTRPDLGELAHYARERGLRTVVSTNGTLITPEKAAELKAAEIGYVGVSLDGLETTHDRFRRRVGAFKMTLDGIRACREVSLKVGARLTLTRCNVGELEGIFELLEREGIPRACFYHLVYTGRGSALRDLDLSHEETRQAVDRIIDLTHQAHARGLPLEVLTVDNHCDGPYLYQRMLREGSPRAAQVLELLRASGGNASGSGIACISWDGTVYADQFWRNHPLGNIRGQPFSELWSDSRNDWLVGLRNRRPLLDTRCRECRFYDLCGGNFRARAEAVDGNPWAMDPACYLTDEEIALAPDQPPVAFRGIP
jgi:radical SAM protein with 4Fe4S-binding SPASM domain